MAGSYIDHATREPANYQDRVTSWADLTHKRLWWHYGPAKALQISRGEDFVTQIDIARWNALGRKAVA